MSKLLLSLSLIFAATFAPAACYTWGLTSGEDETSNGSYLTDVNFTVMFFTGTIGQIDNGDGTWMLDFATANYIAQSSSFDTYFRVGEHAFDASRTHDAVTGIADQPFALLVLDTGKDITDYEKYTGTYALIAGTGKTNQDPDTATDFSVFRYDGAVTADMYKTAAGVPEPTSGLLMLLGLSALALRRKRA